ncbi:MAG: hypothetical protein LBT64_01200 [Puniceicoccales bacterium]|jgi:hypothetical protein|nr:hypothetical protein [Puniceicoccales bacterium]
MELNTALSNIPPMDTCLSAACSMSKTLGFLLCTMKKDTPSAVLLNAPNVAKLMSRAISKGFKNPVKVYVYDGEAKKITAKIPIGAAVAVLKLVRTFVLKNPLSPAHVLLGSVADVIESGILLPLSIAEIFINREKWKNELRKEYGILKLIGAIALPIVFEVTKIAFSSYDSINIAAVAGISVAIAAMRFAIENADFGSILSISESICGFGAIVAFRHRLAHCVCGAINAAAGLVASTSAYRFIDAYCCESIVGYSPVVFLVGMSCLASIIAELCTTFRTKTAEGNAGGANAPQGSNV